MGTTAEEAAAVLAHDPPAFVRGEVPSEQPAHDVRITRGFWIDRTEVTNAAFQAFVDAGGYESKRFWSPAGRRWLAAHTGHRACADEAARGPASPIYPWGDTFDPANANVVGSEGPVAVGSFPTGAGWVGALDMAGNAMEWVSDWLDPRYCERGPAADPPAPARGTVKIEKGGWWGSNPFVARAAYRHFEDPPDDGDEHIGFRVVAGPGSP